MSLNLRLFLLIAGLLLAGACGSPLAGRPGAPPAGTLPGAAAPTVRVVADGLVGPLGMAALPGGGLLIAEEGTGKRDDSAGVSLLLPDGTLGRYLSGLPSSRDSGDLAGAPLVGLSSDGSTLYIGHFGQAHLWARTLSAEERSAGLELPATPLTRADLTPAMRQLNNVFLVNPFDIAFDAAGAPVVTDASGNGVAKETPEGTVRFFHRFDQLANPVTPSDPIEAVPTGMARVGDEYYVALTGGCPFPPGAGKIVAIDEERNQRTLVEGLNMPIDVAVGPDGAIWVLEFATFTPDAGCFSGSGYQVETGRLSRLRSDGALEVVLEGLNFPGAVLPMPDGSLYISEVFPGRILHVTFEGEATHPAAAALLPQQPAETVMAALGTDGYDSALRVIANAHGLQPHPGAAVREGDTPQARLGQLLFFDPILSGDRNISCATCHHPALAMGDGRALPIGTGGEGLGAQRIFVDSVTLGDEATYLRRLAGITDEASGVTTVHNPLFGQFVPRNSSTILNSALLGVQFWDGRVQGYAFLGADQLQEDEPVKTKERRVNELGVTDPLVAQALFPVTSLHEMAGATLGGSAPQAIRNRLVARLRGQPAYVELFRTAYGEQSAAPEEAVTLLRVVQALAAFERRLIFTNAPWDAYLEGDEAALTTQQKRGALLFYGALKPAVNCAVCHSGDLFTDEQFHNLLVPHLGPGKEHGYSRREDWGRAGVTFDARDRYAFRTPTLRNVTLTAPYFHNGAVATLEAVIRHHADMRGAADTYDPSANGVPPELYSSLQPVNVEQYWSSAAPELRAGLPLDDADIADLIAFLDALTDPAARDLMRFVPEAVPSGLTLDELPVAASPGPAAAPAAPRAQQVSAQALAAAPAAVNSLRFEDVAEQSGIAFRQGAFHMGVYADAVAAMGGGLCWIDYNGDGWLDLYLVNSHAQDEEDYWEGNGGLPRNALFRNDRGRFSEAGRAAGVDLALRGNGCVAADFNRDGRTDLYVTAYGPNKLLWNQGDGTFREGAEAAGVAAPEWSSAAAVGDLNGDGWPDLFVGGYIDFLRKIPKPSGAFPQDYYGIPDRLYLSLGADSAGAPVRFREVTLDAGLTREERALGALFSDLDLDGDLDLYIANDGHPNRLYANDPWPGGAAADPLGLGFRLRDITATADVGDTGSGMGIAGGDYDGDGFFDLFVTNWERELNALYRNRLAETGDLVFQYSTYRIGVAGLGNGMTGWGAHLGDFDHDTDDDLITVNGRVPVTNLTTDPELVRLYRNRTWNGDGTPGRPAQFMEWTEQVGLKEVGPLLGRGSAVADYDNDGDLDVAINTIAHGAALLHNSLVEDDGSGTAHWLVVVAADALPGVRAELLLSDGRRLARELHVGSSYLASEDPRLHFGLGPYTQVSQLTVTWPDGRKTVLANIAADQLVRVEAE